MDWFIEHLIDDWWPAVFVVVSSLGLLALAYLCPKFDEEEDKIEEDKIEEDKTEVLCPPTPRRIYYPSPSYVVGQRALVRYVDGRYLVKQVGNLTKPSPGDILTRDQVRDMIGHGVKVSVQ